MDSITKVRPKLEPPTRKSNKRPAEIACDKIRNKFFGKRILPRITDGKKAVVGEFPHMVGLGYKVPGSKELSWNCGGSLISDQYILTAAHCIKEFEKPIVARMGRINIRNKKNCIHIGECEGYDMDIDNIILHKNYNAHTKYNDIALIRLKERFDNQTYELHPACLYTKTDDFNENFNLTITGWGVINYETQEKSDFLLKAIVKPVSKSKCLEAYTTFLEKDDINFEKGISRQLCAHDIKSDTCPGDSGGPIQIVDDTWIQTVVGVTSVGIPCPGILPGIYTRVASYLDWIESMVWPDLKN